MNFQILRRKPSFPSDVALAIFLAALLTIFPWNALAYDDIYGGFVSVNAVLALIDVLRSLYCR